MRKFSPPLRERLRLQQEQNCGHPDVNLLVAFVERNLPPSEHAAMLTHLAECPGCREVLALSSNAGADDALSLRVSPKRRQSWLGWQLAAAAAILCAVIGALWRPSPIRSSPEITASSKPILIGNPASSIPESLVSKESASGTAKLQTRAKDTKKASRQRKDVEFAGGSRAPSRQKGYSTGSRAEGASPPPVTKSGAEAETASGSIDISAAQTEVLTALPRPPAAPVGSTAVAPATAPSEVVVPSFLFSNARRVGSAHGLVAAEKRNERTVWKLGESPTGGRVLKSDDGGRTWRTISVDPRIQFYALSASGSNVWVGGANGKLFHSIDAGIHWTAISVTNGDTTPVGLIVGIEARGDSVTVKTDSGATWTTNDDGLHWREE